MIDKELIKMCDVPEIQDRWEPKVGDRVAGRVSEIEKLITGVTSHGEDDLALHINCDSGFYVHSMTDSFIYIPRIEDVLEWLGDDCGTLHRWTDGGWMVSIKTGQGEYVWASDTQFKCPTKALLEAFMAAEYSKTWNGEAWS